MKRSITSRSRSIDSSEHIFISYFLTDLCSYQDVLMAWTGCCRSWVARRRRCDSARRWNGALGSWRHLGRAKSEEKRRRSFYKKS